MSVLFSVVKGPTHRLPRFFSSHLYTLM